MHGLAAAVLLALVACSGSGAYQALPVEGEGAGASDDPIGAAEGDAPELRRLTRAELVRSLRHVLGPVEVDPTEPDLHSGGLARVGARDVTMSPNGVEQHGFAVERALDQVFADPAWLEAWVGCAPPSFGDAACVASFVRRTGQRAWRRPMMDDEVARYTALQQACVAATGEAREGLRCVASGLLQSPYFVYRVELPRGGVYTGYAMASRLAYLLWSAPPDQALLEAAHRGALDTSEGVRLEAERMLADPKARGGLGVFVEEWFRLDRLDRLERDVLAETAEPVQFQLGRQGKLQPWLQWVAFAAREELRRLVVGHVLDDDADYLDLLITDTAWVDPHLKAFYELPDGEPIGSGLQAPEATITLTEAPDAMGFARGYHGPESPRRGILGTVAVLAQLGKQTETSPSRRGLYIMEKVLCQELGDPPDNIDMCQRPDGVSRRESMEVHHMCAATCSGCHVQMDPIGFAMDGFDTLGRHRTEDDWGFDLDTQVTWTMVDRGQRADLQFNSLRSMADTFYTLPQATRCVTQQMFRLGTGRVEGAGDEAAIDALTEAFRGDGRRLKAFLIHFVGTDAFRRPSAGTPERDPDAPETLEALAGSIFAERCTPCHVGAALGELDLTADAGLEARLRAPSAGVPEMPLVAPGDPEGSYLWHKLVGTHADVGGAGEPMPPNGSLSDEELARVRAWMEGLR